MNVTTIAAETEAEKEILNTIAKHPEARQTIIFAPSLSWDDKMFQRPQQLARAFARRGALVFYMQPDRSWPPVFTEIEERLVICRTPADAFRIVPDAFIYVLTWNIPLLAYFDSPRVIYDYLDDLSVFQGDPQRIRRDHGDYLLKADLVLATSDRLYRQAASLRTDSLLCPNGVDTPHFADSANTIPDDLSPILATGRPVIGYHGAMARWLDYELLAALAKQRPDYSFVLIGSDHDQSLHASGILEQPNIHWLGSKPYNELPRYISRFKVGLIPFVVNEITHATSPIKLFEYFAAGKPVIVSPMEESSRSPAVLIAGTPEEWLEKMEQALKLAEDPKFVELLQTIGRENSWESRAESILERLQVIRVTPRRKPWYIRLQPRNPRIQQVIRLAGRGLKVLRMSGMRGFLKGIYYKFYDRFARLRQSPLFRLPRALEDTYIPEDNSQVTLYTDDGDLLPDYWPRSGLTQTPANQPRPRVSLIATTYNEKKQASEWLKSTLQQSVLPDEIVIVDGGSTDGTFELLNSFAEKSAVPLLVISEKGANIARGRNIAIQNARYDVIAVTDCGCRIKDTWLENLMAPFILEPRTQVVSGWYRAVDSQGRELPYKGWPALGEIDPQAFVPSSRSLAFTKDAWRQAGGYPEWLTLTGEDTYFALELKRFCTHWAFVPSAVVDWIGPLSWAEFWKKAYTWSTGNGVIGYNAWLYRLTARRLVMGLLGIAAVYFLLGYAITKLFHLSPIFSWAGSLLGLGVLLFAGLGWLRKITPSEALGSLGLRIMQTWGFWAGAKRKAQVDLRRLAGTKGLFFILAGVPIDDTGGGARCTQIALELLRQNYWVVYAHRYPKWENANSVIRIAHPNLFTYILGEFEWDDFVRRYGLLLNDRQAYALIEFPSPEFLPFVRKIGEKGVKILYDMIDDWDTSLGNWGYSSSIEREMIRISDDLIATAPALKEKLEDIGQRPAVMLPNAVNSRMFNPDRRHQRPADFPEADWTAIYIGALWGDWFDWDLLTAVANRYPKAAVVVVGDYRGQCSNPPQNLHFLGLKPQSALPAYLSHADVALIPWKVNIITQATSPLKLYEYLAMHRPVVAPDLMPIRGIPGVSLASSFREFIDLVEKVRREPLDIDAIDGFVKLNNWQGRVEQMLKFVQTQ